MNVRTRLRATALEVTRADGRRRIVPLDQVRSIQKAPLRKEVPARVKKNRLPPPEPPPVRSSRRSIRVEAADPPTLDRARFFPRVRPGSRAPERAVEAKAGPARRSGAKPPAGLTRDDLVLLSILPGWSGLNHMPGERLRGAALSALELLLGVGVLVYAGAERFPGTSPLRRLEQLGLLYGAGQTVQPAVQTYSLVRLGFLKDRRVDPRREDAFISDTTRKGRRAFFTAALLGTLAVDVVLTRGATPRTRKSADDVWPARSQASLFLAASSRTDVLFGLRLVF